MAGLLSSLLWAAPAPAQVAPVLSLVVLGDSLSAEYDSLSGIAGVDDPTEYAAISVPGWESMSWVEVLGRLRTNEVDPGAYDPALLGWGAFRFSGYEYNFAIPGFEASQFEQIVNSSLLSDPGYLPYKLQIADTLQDDADAAVVWLGGNELRANYGNLYDGEDPWPLVNALSNDLSEVLDFVLEEQPGIRLVVANLPDLGASPDKQSAHPDPAKRANVTIATILANQAIDELALNRGIPVVDVFSETAKLVNGETVWVGPVDLYPGTHPDNHPRYQFTRDGLHPNTCLQALIAGRIVETFNQAYGAGVTPLSDAEILQLIGIDPMQPYWDWAAHHGLVADYPGSDPDGDGLVNLGEFVFDLDPKEPGPPPLRLDPARRAVYRPHPDRQRLVAVVPEWSDHPGDWAVVPPHRMETNAEGAIEVSFPLDEASGFVRLQLSVRPLD